MRIKPLSACMVDAKLFGRTFAGPSFAAWRTVAKVLDGLPLDAGELALYRALTQREQPPAGAVSEATSSSRAVRAARCSPQRSVCMQRCRTTARASDRARWQRSE